MRLPARAGKTRAGIRRVIGLPALLVVLFSVGVLAAAFLGGLIVGFRTAHVKQMEGVKRRVLGSSFATHVVVPLLETAHSLIQGENVPKNLVSGLLTTDIEHFDIDIGHLDYRRLEEQRERAMELGFLVKGPDDYVPARVRHAGRSYKVEVRLKGDMPEHWISDKWSLRIKLKGKSTIAGMRVFSIQQPRSREYANEWLAGTLARDEGLIAPRFRFVDVAVNGTPKGIFALEEHFDKLMLENAQRREAPIVKFNEDLSWWARINGHLDIGEYGSFMHAVVDGYVVDGFDEGSQFKRAARLLDAFRRGHLKPHEVFHVERMGKYLAVKELVGSWGLDWCDQRFYYDPLTSKLEPIAFDMHADDKPTTSLFCRGGGVANKYNPRTGSTYPRLLFSDPKIFAAYARALDRFSRPEYVDGLFERHGRELARQLATLHREYPFVRSPEPNLRSNAAFLRSILDPATPQVVAHRSGTPNNAVRIRVAASGSLPVEVTRLIGPDGAAASLAEPRVLMPAALGEPMDYVEVDFPAASTTWAGTVPVPLQLETRIVGCPASTRTTEVLASDFVSDGPGRVGWLLQPSELGDVECLEVDAARGTIRFREGRWTLERNLVLPAGYRVLAGPGVTLDLRRGAQLLSYSPVDLRGTASQPVLITSGDGSGQGFAVLSAAGRSHVEHVTFDNLGEPVQDGWHVPGAVTFYESDVEIVDSVFRRNRSEDALHVMRANFVMRGTSFADTRADAFDGDFTSGLIDRCGFVRCGNDAIDVSGSDIELRNIRIDGAGDKAISAGEQSRIRARGIEIRGAEIAWASKDRSSITVDGTRVLESRVGFTAFRKKPEFGPAQIIATGVTVQAVERLVLLERESKIVLDGEHPPDDQKNVERILYGNKYGKSSR